MKHPLSFIAIVLIALSLIFYRTHYARLDEGKSLMVTNWDVYGYYLYLPGIFVYNDLNKMDWHDRIQEKYHVMGDRYYQVQHLENGNKISKYTIGTAILQAPWFFIGHYLALNSDYPADGFSPPYQYAIAYGLLIYTILAFILLRWLLLRYFKDHNVALSLLLLLLASNLIQYTAIDNAQSHSPLFFHYTLILVLTYKWHRKPHMIWAALMGLTIGLATITRPTELIIVLIPLLWGTEDKIAAHFKWQMVRNKWPHLMVLVIFTFLAALPQFAYWKYTTGHYLHKMASAWDFLTPHLRVLFWFEKGWFIYTPVTIFFIAGMFRMKDFPFRKAVLWFCFLNIYIVISWRDWHYGGSYSTRALTQSYPVFALALTAFIEGLRKRHWRYGFYALSVYLIGVNLFQIYQYNMTWLHFRQMNGPYYAQIYLNPKPRALDASFLDTKDRVRNKEHYEEHLLFDQKEIAFAGDMGTKVRLAETRLPENCKGVEVILRLRFDEGYGKSRIVAKQGKGEKEVSFRSAPPMCRPGIANLYHFYFTPENTGIESVTFSLWIDSREVSSKGEAEHVAIKAYTEQLKTTP